MVSTIAIYAVLYASLAVFVVASIVRAAGYARLPLHLRWEIYPVPHEEKGRAAHGGSYFEMKDWWTQPAKFNRSGELKAMLAEMLFLKGLWEFKKKTWYRSYPFHLGLYLLFGATALLFSSAFLWIVAPRSWAAGPGIVLHGACVILGPAGIGLTLAGAAGLLLQRLTDADLKPYTTPADIFNLLFFIVAAGFLAAGYLWRGKGSFSAFALARGLLTFDAGLRVPALFGFGLVLGALLVAYIPLTHMSHFIAKYFTYHSVRWGDQPNGRGSGIEKRIAEMLTYRPTWAAPHIGADGAKTWAEIAITNPAQGGKK